MNRGGPNRADPGGSETRSERDDAGVAVGRIRAARASLVRGLGRQAREMERLRAESHLGVRAALVLASYPSFIVAAQFAVGDARLLFAFYRPAAFDRLPDGFRAAFAHLPPWWHDFTRLSHALVHDPAAFHLHLWTNVVGIALFATALYVVCDAAGWRPVFYAGYFALAAFAPVVASFVYEAYGAGALAWGASTVGFAYLGLLAAAFVARLRRLDPAVGRWWAFAPAAAAVPARIGVPAEPLIDGLCLLFVAFVVGDARVWIRRRVASAAATVSDGDVSARRRADAIRATLGFLVAVCVLPALDALTNGGGNVAHQTGFLVGVTFGAVLLTFVADTADTVDGGSAP